MREIRTKLDVKMQKELNKQLKVIYIVMLIIGAVVLISSFSPLFNEKELILAYFGVFSIVAGILMLISLNRSEKLMSKTKENIYAFNEDHIFVTTYNADDKISESKFYYKEIVKMKETKNYIFIFINVSRCLPISKDGLTATEIMEIKSKQLDRRKNEKI